MPKEARRRVVPDAPSLAADLFSAVSAEDLAGSSPADIAAYVASAEELLTRRQVGRHVVRLSDHTSSGGGRTVTLVEVLNDDMPFLVDSVVGELHDFGAEIRVVAHPVVAVTRDRHGRLTGYFGREAPPGGCRESLIQVHVERLAGAEARTALVARLDATLTEVRRAVDDWKAMRVRLARAIAQYRKDPPPLPKAETDEAVAFLEWLLADNFTFLGIREYEFFGGDRKGDLKRREMPGLGILGDPHVRVLRRGGEAVTMTPAIRAYLMRPEALIIAKADAKSRVHRRAYMDYIGVKEFAKGELVGELRIVGLFTSTAYTRSIRTIPLLRHKVDRILRRAGFDPAGHSGKTLINVLESYPREELFYIDEELLLSFALSIVALEEHARVRVLVRPDRFDRYVSVIVFVPRERYESGVRVRIGEYLAAAFDGHVSGFYPYFPEAMPLTRVHFIIGRSGGPTPRPTQAALEHDVAAIVRTWMDDLRRLLLDQGERAPAILGRYESAFPAAYRDDFSPERALADLDVFEQLTAEAPLSARFLPATRGGTNAVGLRLVHLGSPIALSQCVPVLEHMGFRVIDERSYEIAPGDGRPPIHVHDMVLLPAGDAAVDLAARGAALTDCFAAVWFRHAENDDYNGLVLNAGLAWREAALLRAVSRYLHQAGTPYAQHYMAQTLNRHATIARLILQLFAARFDPAALSDAAAATAVRNIETELEKVESLDEDRIVRRMVNLVEAMLRTNFFRAAGEGQPNDLISFKLDARSIEALPEPRPYREIFVHSPRVDGVHLRFGKVARGGIRWSDRPQDFRTEILGLVKAQQVKNAVIVPVGAKGGFVPKWLLQGGGREAILAEGQAAYRIFIGALLDLTDDLDGEKVVPPRGVIRRDEDDPYLVVAADKGTATFSDIANGIAVERGFWLGDAFASGGSAGYDHKAMGITARGAWEAVKRHFREVDVDIQTTPFSAVGVGDMSGDVFGNAMLLSPATRLVAAFDHRDIIIDPDPDPATSLKERQRLFALPRSSWQDYDRSKISAGGEVFSRRDKSLKLSPEIRKLLDLPKDRATPQEVMQAILRARADLLWFGGIGTFVKAAGESDDAVGDRANDAIRITAQEIRAKVVGEGANLGMTQRGRIEFGLVGGRCNSDAIDNSAGVNTSDVEVNIKIALGRAVRDGRMNLKKRNKLLVTMTGEVARLVLRNNYLQTLAISLAERRGMEDFDFQLRMMQELAGRGILNRAVEILPDDAAMAERHKSGRPLTRAEIGVLLAYAKIALTDDLLATDLPDDPAMAPELTDYFPKQMRKAHAGDIEAHRLRRDIIATRIANSMVNRGGPTYTTRIADRTGAGPAALARAYYVVRHAFGLNELNAAIDALDGKAPGAVQLGLYRQVQDLLIAQTVWFLRNVSFDKGTADLAAGYASAVEEVGKQIKAVMPARIVDEIGRRADECRGSGVPEKLANRMALLSALAEAPQIHLVAAARGVPIARAASTFFAVAEHLHITRLEALANSLSAADYYDGLALDRALATLADSHRRIAIAALAGSKKAAEPLDAWLAPRRVAVDRVVAANAAMVEGGVPSISRLTVAAGLLADLAR